MHCWGAPGQYKRQVAPYSKHYETTPGKFHRKFP